MEQITINVPDNKVAFFKNLIKELKLEQVENRGINMLTSNQKLLIKKELKEITENADNLLDWETVKDQIDWQAC